MTNEMIERAELAARSAVADATGTLIVGGDHFIARAVLKELMTPTDEMVEAGELVAVRDFIPAGQYIPLVWQAMLTQALNEEEGE